MSIVAIVFLLWVLFTAVRGYKRGLWSTLFGLLGLIGAYLICLFWGASFTPMMLRMGMNVGLATATSYVGVFVLTNLLISLLPLLLFPGLWKEENKKPIIGAVLGGVIGVAGGLLAVGVYDLLHSSLGTLEDTLPAESRGADFDSAVSREQSTGKMVECVAQQVVSKALHLGVKMTGTNDIRSKAIMAMSENPRMFMNSVKSISQSLELKAFFDDRDIQYLLATNDFDGLVENEKYQRLLAHQDMVTLKGMASLEDDKSIAEHATKIWQRLKYYQNDPRVQNIVADPAIKQRLAMENPIALMANPKVYELMGIFLTDSPELNTVDFTRFVKPPVSEVQLDETSTGLPIYQD